jgi:hypothetical protein
MKQQILNCGHLKIVSIILTKLPYTNFYSVLTRISIADICCVLVAYSGEILGQRKSLSQWIQMLEILTIQPKVISFVKKLFLNLFLLLQVLCTVHLRIPLRLSRLILLRRWSSTRPTRRSSRTNRWPSTARPRSSRNSTTTLLNRWQRTSPKSPSSGFTMEN